MPNVDDFVRTDLHMAKMENKLCLKIFFNGSSFLCLPQEEHYSSPSKLKFIAHNIPFFYNLEEE